MTDLVWVHGVRGPEPQKWHYHENVMASSQHYWKALIIRRIPVKEQDAHLPLTVLARIYPLGP